MARTKVKAKTKDEETRKNVKRRNDDVIILLLCRKNDYSTYPQGRNVRSQAARPNQAVASEEALAYRDRFLPFG